MRHLPASPYGSVALTHHHNPHNAQEQQHRVQLKAKSLVFITAAAALLVVVITIASTSPAASRAFVSLQSIPQPAAPASDPSAAVEKFTNWLTSDSTVPPPIRLSDDIDAATDATAVAAAADAAAAKYNVDNTKLLLPRIAARRVSHSAHHELHVHADATGVKEWLKAPILPPALKLSINYNSKPVSNLPKVLSPVERAVVASANRAADADDKTASAAINSAAAAAAAAAAASAHKQLAVISHFSPGTSKSLSPAEKTVVKAANAVADASDASVSSAISAAVAAASAAAAASAHARKAHLAAAAAAPLESWQKKPQAISAFVPVAAVAPAVAAPAAAAAAAAAAKIKAMKAAAAEDVKQQTRSAANTAGAVAAAAGKEAWQLKPAAIPPPITLKVRSEAPAAVVAAAAPAAAADDAADADSGVSVSLQPRSYDYEGKLYMPSPAPAEGYPPVFIYCDNLSDSRLRFAMIMPDGTPKPYRTIHAGEKNRQQAYANETWSIVDQNGKDVVKRFKITQENQWIVVPQNIHK